MQKQLIGGKAYGYKQQVKYIDRNSICIMDVYYLHFQYYHAGVEWGTLCSGNHYLCECVYYFLCYYWLLLQNIRKMEDSAKYLKWTRFCRIVGIVAFIVAGCIVLLV